MSLTVFAAVLLLLPMLLPVQGLAAAQSLSAPPNVVAVHSRKAHGAAGTFSLNLAPTPQNPTTEPRSGGTGGDHALIFVFDKPVSSGTAMVTEGVAVAGAPTFAGNEMRVPLSAVANRQYVTLAVTNVTATDGSVGGGSVRLGFLVGDVNGSRNVTLSDQMAVNSALSRPATSQNFLLDVNASGAMTIADLIMVQGNLTRTLPAPDAAAPTVTITSPASGTAFTAPQTVTITASAFDNAGVSKVELYKGVALMGTVTSPPYALDWPVTSNDNGTHVWTAVAYGSTSSAVSSPTTLFVDIPTADGTAPSIAISVPTTASSWSTTSAFVTLAGTASDNVGVTGVSWANAANGTSGSMSGTTFWSGGVSLAPGGNVITVTARDAANNAGAAVLTVTYTPNLPPVPGPVTTGSTQFGGFLSTPFTLSATFGSGTALTGCEYTTNGGSSWAPGVVSGAIPSFTCAKAGITASNGQVLTLNLRATNAGGTGTATSITRTIDAAAPVTGSNAPTAWVATDQSVILTASDTAGSGVAGTQYCADAANTCTPAIAGTAVSVTCASGAACLTYVRFRSTDNIGNLEATRSALVRIDKAAPSNGALTTTPGNAQVVLSWSGISDNGSGLSASIPYKLVFGTGAAPASCNAGTALFSGTGTGFTHTGLTNGSTYHYRLCAVDAVGNVSAGVTASVTPQGANQPPVADAGPDQTVPVDASVTLSGAGSADPDGNIVSYAWNFGDGTSANSGSVPTVAHTYSKTGTYTVTLTVTDNTGATASDTATLTVGSPGEGTYRWAKRFGGAGAWVLSYGTAVDGEGNVIVVGTHWGTANLGSGAQTSAGSSDIFVAKYQPDGTPIWSTRFGSTYDDAARAVAVDSSGNIYLVGSFKGTVNFGGGPLTSAYMGFGSRTRDAFIVKLSASGAHQWSRNLGSEADDTAYGVAVDRNANVVVTGAFSGPVDFGNGEYLQSAGMLTDVFLAKYSSTGALEWAQRFGDTSSDTGNGVATDGSGNILVTGAFSGRVDFGGGAETSIGESSDIFLAKFTPQGDHVWSMAFGDSGLDVGTAVATDRSGNVVLTGYFQGSANFGGEKVAGYGVLDAFVAKYAPSGEYLWARGLGGAEVDEGFGIATDSGGNVFVVGTLQGTADFGTGPLQTAGSYDVVAAKYAPDGTPRWAKRFGGTGDDFGYAVASDGSGNAVFCGVVQGAVDFGGGPVSAIGVTDMFILNLSP